MKRYYKSASWTTVLLAVLFHMGVFSNAQSRAQTQQFKLDWAGATFDAYTPDGVVYWIVGDGGRIRHTTDPTLSTNWTRQIVPTEVKDTLHRIYFLSDGLTGWAVGQSGWIVATLDGGLNWSILAQAPAVITAEGPFEELYGVRFFDVNHGWVLGKHGLWYTTTGGSGWTSWTAATLENETNGTLTSSEIAAMDLYSLDMTPVSGSINVGLGLAVGEPGWVFRAANVGGTVWNRVWTMQKLCPLGGGAGIQECEKTICATPPAAFDLWGVKISRSTTDSLVLMNGGIGGSCGMILSSTDNGANWAKEYHECDCPSLSYAPDCHDCSMDDLYRATLDPAHTYHLNNYKTIYGVSIFNGDNSAIASGYAGQHLYRHFSTTTGQAGHWVWRDRSTYDHTFTSAPSAVIMPLQGASADPTGTQANGKGLIVGEGGHIRRTVNGGEVWSDSFPGDPYRIKDVYFTSPAAGWKVGQLFSLSQTMDSGQHWAAATPVPVLGTADLTAITFASDGQNGIAVGQADSSSSGFPNKPKILRTTDNGLTQWLEPLVVGADLTGMMSDGVPLRCVTRAGTNADGTNNFWTAGQSGLIYQSSDGGR
jgi:photosystem II stability/assembly factor-like uncharacterized protein